MTAVTGAATAEVTAVGADADDNDVGNDGEGIDCDTTNKTE